MSKPPKRKRGPAPRGERLPLRPDARLTGEDE
jgi:hypothetical protein